MADFLICPRCRRQNPADAIFCNRCGVRLLSAGVSYRNRSSSSAVGMSQIVLGLGVLILAGLVLGGGAVVLLGGQRPTPSRIAGLPSTSPSGLQTFVQPTATPTTAPSPTFVLPTLIPTVAPTSGPTVAPSPTPGPTNPPHPTPQPTPQATPVDCAVASTGTNVKELVLGYGNKTTKGPLGKTWCIRDVTIHPVFNPGITTGYGTARLMRGDKLFDNAEYTCASSSCGDAPFTYAPPRRIAVGSTLRYEFTCQNSDETPLEDDCADAIDDGMTIIIHYEAF